MIDIPDDMLITTRHRVTTARPKKVSYPLYPVYDDDDDDGAGMFRIMAEGCDTCGDGMDPFITKEHTDDAQTKGYEACTTSST